MPQAPSGRPRHANRRYHAEGPPNVMSRYDLANMPNEAGLPATAAQLRSEPPGSVDDARNPVPDKDGLVHSR